MIVNGYGRADMRGIVQSVTKKDYLRYIVYAAEIAEAEMRRMGKETGRGLTKQVTMGKFMAEIIRRVTQHCQTNLSNYLRSWLSIWSICP